MKTLFYILLSIVICLIIFLIGLNVGMRNVEPQYITEVLTDTIRLKDTVEIEKPVPQYITQTKEKIDTVIKIDTIEIPLSFPVVEKEYQDSTYKAVVKGVQFGSYPSLESLEIYQMTNYITKTITTQQKANKWGLDASFGLGVSYDLYNHRMVPTVGVQLGWGYRIK